MTIDMIIRVIMDHILRRAVGLAFWLSFSCLAQAGPVVIGVDLGLSARSNASGRDAREALEDYARLINRQGGVLSGRRLEFRFLDNRGVADRSLENLQMLQSRSDVIAVIGGQEAALVQERVRLSKPLILAWGLHATTPGSGLQFGGAGSSNTKSDPSMVFHVTPPIADQLSQILHRASRPSPAVVRIGLVTSSDGIGRVCRDALVETLVTTPALELSLAEQLPALGADFSGLWRAIGIAKPDSLIWCAPGEALSQWIAWASSARQGQSVRSGALARPERTLPVYGLLTLGNPMVLLGPSPLAAIELSWFTPRLQQNANSQSAQYQFAYHLISELTAAMRQARSLGAIDLMMALRARESLILPVQIVDSPPQRPKGLP